MGLFSRKTESSGSASAGSLQIPDQLAQRAAREYGTSNFMGALELYGEAIDKIHTMCVVASPSGRIRSLGAQDQPILDGFNNSLGAALAMDSTADVDRIVEQTLGYLREIAADAGPGDDRYALLMSNIDVTYRLGRGA